MGHERQLLHASRSRASCATTCRSRPAQHTWKFGAGAQSSPITATTGPSLGTWTFTVDQPFNPANLASFVPLPGSVTPVLDAATSLKLPTFTPERHVGLLRGRRMEAGRRRHAEPGPSLRLSGQGVQPGADARSRRTRCTIRCSRRRARRRAWRRSSHFSTSAATRTTSARGSASRGTCSNDSKTVVRADYGLYYNPMNLQITSAELQNFRQPTAIIANPTYPDPYGGRDPSDVRVDRRRRTSQVHGRRSREPAVGGLHRRRLAGARPRRSRSTSTASTTR